MVTTVSINAGGAPFVDIQDSGGAEANLSATNVDNTLAIGGDLTVADGINMLSLGANNQLDGQGNDQGDIDKVVQIGFGNTYNEIFGFGGLGDNIQIGFDNTHTASATENIQIGNDITTNASTRSVVIGHTITLNSNCPDAILIGQAPAVAPNSTNPIAIGPAAGISGGSDNCISLGSSASCTSNNTIALGPSATASGLSTVAIGDSVLTDNSSFSIDESVAIGARASVNPTSAITPGAVVIGVDAAAANGVGQVAIGDTAVTGAANAVQLSTGTNNTANTIQYLTQPIANNFGIQAKTVAVTPTDAATDGTIQVDNVADALYFRSGGAWIEAVSGSGAGITEYADVRLTGNVNLPDSTVVTIDWDTETADTNGFHDNVVNPSRLTIPVGGDGSYQIVHDVTFGANGAGIRQVQIFKNGTQVTGDVRPASSATALVQFQTFYFDPVAVAGDFYDTRVLQDSGIAISYLASARTRFQIYKFG